MNGKSKYLISLREPTKQFTVGAKSVLIYIEGSPGVAFLKPKLISLLEDDVTPRYRRVM